MDRPIVQVFLAPQNIVQALIVHVFVTMQVIENERRVQELLLLRNAQNLKVLLKLGFNKTQKTHQ